ncbi:hypothetical protein BCR39DRAFT_562377 [Naematelia encephala]|uniref:Uncharacterized protein n=1 Tax=Naematelia encephala TaxID=71784 RepID=A0A1Y2AJ58_9TREE|nr:hypothetical protein BCR39DRAFT_562377 [Naematelia encephala]
MTPFGLRPTLRSHRLLTEETIRAPVARHSLTPPMLPWGSHVHQNAHKRGYIAPNGGGLCLEVAGYRNSSNIIYVVDNIGLEYRCDNTIFDVYSGRALCSCSGPYNLTSYPGLFGQVQTDPCSAAGLTAGLPPSTASTASSTASSTSTTLPAVATSPNSLQKINYVFRVMQFTVQSTANGINKSDHTSLLVSAQDGGPTTNQTLERFRYLGGVFQNSTCAYPVDSGTDLQSASGNHATPVRIP